tara:strand:+ start:6313 stop:6450 length:138 start_codon:yes stop_codon:yes gene_type:complete
MLKISEKKLIIIYNFLDDLGHLKVLNVNKAKTLANEIKEYVQNNR